MEGQQESQARRPSLLERMHLRKSSTQGSDGNAEPGKSSDDASSMNSHSQLLGKSDGGPKQKKERREKYSDSGPFKIVVDENGNSRCVENGDWPPGTHYKVPDRINKNQGLSDFYTNKTVVDGGAGLSNIGPDPDWIPGLTEEERSKLRKDRSGQYVF